MSPDTNPAQPISPEIPEPQASAETVRHSHHHHSHHGDSGTHRRRSQRAMLALALGISLLLLVAVSLFAMIRIGTLVGESDTLSAELFQARQQLAELKPEVERLRRDASKDTQSRLPHLRPLVPDNVILIDSGYVKNVVFTLLRSGSSTRYEYRMVLENRTDSVIKPDLRVLVFDQSGVQIGSGEVADRTEIASGESRSYSSHIELFMDEVPRYFYVWTRNKKKAGDGK